MTALIAIETVVLALLVLLIAGLLRSHATILRRLHDLGAGVDDASERERTPRDSSAATPTPVERSFSPIQTRPGVPAPGSSDAGRAAHDVAGSSLADDAVALRVVNVEHDTVLAFLSTGCLTCKRFWEALAEPDSIHLPTGARLIVVAKDPSEESPTELAQLAPKAFELVMSSQAWSDYEVPGSPYVVFVEGASGRVRGEGTGMGWDQVANLLSQATGDLSFVAGESGRRTRKPESDSERESRIDQELMAAGIFPGDPRLYPQSESSSPSAEASTAAPDDEGGDT